MIEVENELLGSQRNMSRIHATNEMSFFRVLKKKKSNPELSDSTVIQIDFQYRSLKFK